MPEQTIHTKENGQQVTYQVVAATDATGKRTGEHTFRATPRGEDPHEYVGEGNPLDAGWTPAAGLDRTDAPKSALEEIEAFEGSD